MRPQELLARLVAFDSVSRNSNLPIIAFIEDYLRGFGVESLRIDYVSGVKQNLFATIGPRVPGGVVLSGHTDVVPVDGQPWTVPAFEVTERDGRLYGRGTCDMKGFLACVLAKVPDFVAAPLKRPVHLAFSCDEEVGCMGVIPMVEHIAAHVPKPACCIVGEPTGMRVVDAHKSIVTYVTEVTGREAHSSLTHRGVNAIVYAAKMIGEADMIAEDFRRRGDPSGRFDPPYSTLHVGVIAGGTVKNIVPRHCRVQWETRLLPGADEHEAPARLRAFAATLEPSMKAVSADAGIETRRIADVPGLAPDPGSAAESLAFHLTGRNGTEAVSYGTEAGHFQRAGIATVVCGPGSIEQAHKPDEFIARSELGACGAFLDRLIATLTQMKQLVL